MLKDVQSEVSENKYPLNRVGVRGVKKPIIVYRPQREVPLNLEIDVYVDLPPIQKGAHMSRNIEVVHDILDMCMMEKVTSLEELCQRIAKRLLDRHEYATRSEVYMKSDYFIEKMTPYGRKSVEPYNLIARAIATRERNKLKLKKMIGVEVVGMSVCPCAMENVKNYLIKEYRECKELFEKVPVITHNQRNITFLLIEVPEEYHLEADDMISIVEESQSSPTYEVIKREEEVDLVINAHKKPMFVEDIVRNVLRLIVTKFIDMPNEAEILVRSTSYESIHKHDAFAEIKTRMKDIREQEM